MDELYTLCRHLYVRCPAGFYTNGPSNDTTGGAIACTANNYCSGGDARPSPWTVTSCTPGKYLSTSPSATSDGVCSSCPVNSYCTGGTANYQAVTVTSCTAGNYLSTSPSALSNGVCSTCTVSGDYCAGGTAAKIRCPLGSYCSSTSTKVACSLTNYCAEGSTSQTACPEGYYCRDASTKTICPVAHYCPAGSSAAIPCPAGTMGIYEESLSLDSCESCPAGSAAALGSSECTPCIGTTWSEEMAGSCTACSVLTCSSSQYKVECTLTSDTSCARCADPPANADITDYTDPTCPYDCNSPYVKDASTGFCCTLCNNGYYNPSCTKTSSGSCNTCSN